MSFFVGGTLVVLSGILLLCRRCWEVQRHLNRCVPTALLPSPGPSQCVPRVCRDSGVRGDGCMTKSQQVGSCELRTLPMGTSPEGPCPILLSCCPTPETQRRQRRPPPPTWKMAPTLPKVRCCPGPALHPGPAPSTPGPPDRLCLSVSPTRLGAARFRLISVSLKPTRRCSQAHAERVSV